MKVTAALFPRSLILLLQLFTSSLVSVQHRCNRNPQLKHLAKGWEAVAVEGNLFHLSLGASSQERQMDENFLGVRFGNQQVNPVVLRNIVILMLIPALGLFSLLPSTDLLLFLEATLESL